MNAMNIEGKVPIAADAAALVIAYLDELNTKLNQAGVKNAYLIVADVESLIIEALKRQGKKTKLGNEEVLSIINEEFDDPDEFVKIYLADMNPEIHEEKMDRFMVDPNQRRLIRRPRHTNQQIQEGDKSILTSMFNYAIFSSPILLLIVAIILNITSTLGNGFDYTMESVVLTILAVIIFVTFFDAIILFGASALMQIPIFRSYNVIIATTAFLAINLLMLCLIIFAIIKAAFSVVNSDVGRDVSKAVKYII